jgi:hypothetical protein
MGSNNHGSCKNCLKKWSLQSGMIHSESCSFMVIRDYLCGCNNGYPVEGVIGEA